MKTITGIITISATGNQTYSLRVSDRTMRCYNFKASGFGYHKHGSLMEQMMQYLLIKWEIDLAPFVNLSSHVKVINGKPHLTFNTWDIGSVFASIGLHYYEVIHSTRAGNIKAIAFTIVKP